MLKLTIKPLVLSAALALSLTAGIGNAVAEEMSAGADLENGIVMKQVSDHDSNYCHIKYNTFTERGLKSGDLELNQSEVVDMYGSCAFDPKGSEEVQKQLAQLNQAAGDSSNDSSGD